MTDSHASDPSLDESEQRDVVRDRYSTIATDSSSGCSDACCDEQQSQPTDLGYEEDAVASIDAAELSLGCGNPTAIATLEPGETVLDLGSGGGFDCFLAAREVGGSGRVIGVDMTPEMVERARENAQAHDASNVEFRLGEIEHLPVADDTVDVVISNCVLNLSPDKPQALQEAYRVMRPGGRLAVSDVVRTATLPVDLATDPESVAACVGGAATISELERMLSEAGFANVSIEPDEDSREFIREWDDERDLSDYIVSATVEARKPDSDHRT